MSLETRIERLEAQSEVYKPVLVWAEAHEATEEVLQRHLQARPGDADSQLLVISWARPGETFDPARDA